MDMDVVGEGSYVHELRLKYEKSDILTLESNTLTLEVKSFGLRLNMKSS